MPLLALLALTLATSESVEIAPARVEIVKPIHKSSFNNGGKAKNRRQGGNPRIVDGRLVFDGSSDGDRQVDPQIAVGGGYVLHGTNSGIVIYDRAGNYVDGVPQREFNDGIDPKMYFDPHNRVFAFDMWVYWDKEKIKPVNIAVSETSNPTGAWNTYPISAKDGVDGGGIGYSRKWIGYSFPGGPEECFVLSMAEAKSGKPASVYHFAGSLGHPVFTQDPTDDLLFVELTDTEIVLRTVGANKAGIPVVKRVVRNKHNFKYFDWPPAAPMKGTELTTSSGDRNPKNLVVQGKHLWFSQAVNVEGRAGVQWHEVDIRTGKFLQSGLIAHPKNSYIQTTIAVNKLNDVLVGFQETGPDMFISARYAYRKASDPKGTLRPIVGFATGLAATKGGPWGDYSSTVIDGDNRLDLWTIQSFATKDGRGGTAITKVRP